MISLAWVPDVPDEPCPTEEALSPLSTQSADEDDNIPPIQSRKRVYTEQAVEAEDAQGARLRRKKKDRCR